MGGGWPPADPRAHVHSCIRGLSGTGNRTQTRKGRRTKGTQDKRHIIIHIIIFCFLFIYSLEGVQTAGFSHFSFCSLTNFFEMAR